MQQIREYFNRIAEQSDEDWKFFSARLARVEFPARTVLLNAGRTEQFLSFIEHGIVRFFIPGDENDLTFSFAFAGNFVSAYDSFLSQKPCGYCVDALTDVVLWRLKYGDLQEIYQRTEIGNLIGRHASEDLFLKKSRREVSLLNESAEQRYLNLFTEQPHLIQEIPLKYIASYIGITPQGLSRIRRRIAKHKAPGNT